MHRPEAAQLGAEYRDLSQVVELIDAATNPTVELSMAERKRVFVERLAQLIDADVYIWSTTVTNHAVPGDFMTTCILDGGWRTPEEQGRVYELLTSVEFNTAALRGVYEMIIRRCRATLTTGEIFPPEDDARLSKIWRTTGFEWFLVATHPLDDDFSSNVGFHRRIGRPPFGPREKALVDAVYHGVDWLHVYGTNESVRPVTLRLSPRERQTLIFVLAGYSHKAIAERMQITHFTVNDYVKQLHKHFNVGSRAELQARFFVGVPAPAERE